MVSGTAERALTGGKSLGTLSSKKKPAPSEDAGVGASELQGEFNSVLLIDESSEKVKIWGTLGSLECLVEGTFFLRQTRPQCR